MLSLRTAFALTIVSGLPLSGCLVSFEDYPLVRDDAGVGANGGTAIVSTGGASMGGTSTGGTSMGGTSTGGASMGGDASGGANNGGVAAGGDGMGGMPVGGTEAGGSAGSGGSPPMPDPFLIDDFEDGNSQLLPNAGRNGTWFAFNDTTSRQTPPAGDAPPSLLSPPRGTSTRALHTSGYNFTNWGALVGASFVGSGMNGQPYDISAYSGVTFTAKLGNSMATKAVRVSIRNAETLSGCTICGDHFGANVNLSDAFQTFQVPFSTFKQAGWGKPQLASFDTTKTYALTFAWGPRVLFDAWIDDVSFY